MCHGLTSFQLVALDFIAMVDRPLSDAKVSALVKPFNGNRLEL